MAKHLLTCACGRQIEVEPGQAGGTTACACGATVSVPTLRQLRQLPRAIEDGAAAPRGWGARQGVVAACVILAVACLLVAAASRYSQPELPTFDAAVRSSAVERGLAGLTPASAWRLWVDTYEPLAARGMSEFKPPGVVEIDHVLAALGETLGDEVRRAGDEDESRVGKGSRDLPPVAGSATEDMVIHPENPVPGTVAMVDGIIGAFATDMNVRVRHEGIPDVRGFFEVADIKLPEGSKIDAQTGELPSMEPFEVWVDDNVRVSATLVYHGEVFPSLAYRFDTANGSVVFSGDTAVSENLIRLAKDADILVHEAIDPSWVAKIVGPEPWDDRQKALAHQLETTHVTPRQAGEVATKAGVKTLVLSHLVPGDAPREHWLEAGETFKGNLIIGEDLAEIKLGD